MIRWAREFRLVPIVVVATASLFALKTLALLVDGGYTLGGSREAQAQDAGDRAAAAPEPDGQPPQATGPKRGSKPSWAQEIFGYPEHTGSVGAAAKPPDKPAGPPGKPPDKIADATTKPGDPAAGKNEPPPEGRPPPPLDLDRPMVSPGERAVLESLNRRRQDLEARARALDVRESLIGAAEKRIEGRFSELKELEARVNAAIHKKDEGEAARFKGLVTMYENMKAKDAAKIFDRLDLKILIEVATQINPRRMSDILAQMSPEAAERLTIEIATRAGAVDKGLPAPELPKIEGRPNGT